MHFQKFLNSIFFIFISVLIIGIVYFFTLAPSVTQIDTGELAAVQALLGIAHPTGYPLFTVLGNLFLKIPLFHSPIRQLNFLAMLWCVFGIVFFILSAKRIVASDQNRLPAENGFSVNNAIAAIAAGFFLAFSKTFWTQSTFTDVFPLHIFLVTAALAVSFLCLFEEKPSFRTWALLAFTLALCFSNHMTSIFLLPGLLILFLTRFGLTKRAWNIFSLCAVVFLLTASAVYLYLPFRAAQDPIYNWGNPVNWADFIRHVSGRQYSVWMFKSSEAARVHLNNFIDNFPSEFTWFGLSLGIIGLVVSLFRSIRLFVFIAVAFLFTVLYSVNYDIHDLESYFLLAYVVFAFWIAVGIKTLLVKSRKTLLIKIGLIVLITCGIAYEAVSNFKKTDLSDYHIFEDYSKQILDSMPKNALLITYQWDYLVSPAYYFQSVEGWRNDVALIDKELLRRSWYFHQLEGNHPVIVSKVKPEISSFLEALRPFETGGVFNPQLLDRLYARMIQRLMETHLDQGGVFLGPELVDKELRSGEIILPEGCLLVPDLFFYRVVRANSPYVPLEKTSVAIRFPRGDNPYVANVKQFTARMMVQRTLYESQNGKYETASQLKQNAKSLFPDIEFPE